jgi:hypothetical protein
MFDFSPWLLVKFDKRTGRAIGMPSHAASNALTLGD